MKVTRNGSNLCLGRNGSNLATLVRNTTIEKSQVSTSKDQKKFLKIKRDESYK